MSIHAVESLVRSTREFFKDPRAVNNNLHKVLFYEKEADRIGNNLKRRIFETKMELSKKMHLRYFASHIERVSDRAEEVADRLAIYTIKRTI
jgi:uncharacterized protein Yka (UPF0111/DUF47 family)